MRPIYLFAHIPKTGGRALWGHIGERLGSRAAMLEWTERPGQINIETLAARPAAERDILDYIGGHGVSRAVAELFPGRDARFVTVLREPVALAVSMYNWSFRGGREVRSFEEWFATRHSLGARWLLRGMLDIGWPAMADYSQERLLNEAGELLRKFWLVAKLEDLDNTIAPVIAALGLPPGPVEKRNVGGQDYRTLIERSPELDNYIRARSRVDIALYNEFCAGGIPMPAEGAELEAPLVPGAATPTGGPAAFSSPSAEGRRRKQRQAKEQRGAGLPPLAPAQAARGKRTLRDRHPAIYRTVRDAAGPGPLRILSFGCSTGAEPLVLAERFFKGSGIVGVDRDRAAVQKARRLTKHLPNVTIAADGNLGASGPYDAIFATAAFCRRPQARKSDFAGLFSFGEFEASAAALAGHVKPGGLFVLFDSSYSLTQSRLIRHFDLVVHRRIGLPGTVRRFGADDRPLTHGVATDFVFRKRAEPWPDGDSIPLRIENPKRVTLGTIWLTMPIRAEADASASRHPADPDAAARPRAVLPFNPESTVAGRAKARRRTR